MGIKILLSNWTIKHNLPNTVTEIIYSSVKGQNIQKFPQNSQIGLSVTNFNILDVDID